MTDLPDLKPCPNPWCEADECEGDFSPVVMGGNSGIWQVYCTSCLMSGPFALTEAEAIARWNRRPTTAQPPEPQPDAGVVSLQAAPPLHRARGLLAEVELVPTDDRASIVRWLRKEAERIANLYKDKKGMTDIRVASQLKIEQLAEAIEHSADKEQTDDQ